MKKSIRKKLLDAYWLGEKEAQILRDAVPWPENDEPDDIDITVPVGPPYDVKETEFEGFSEMWADRNRLRIDVVIHLGPRRVVTEVTPTIGAGSTGKISLYTHYYGEDKGIGQERIQPCLLGRSVHTAAKGYCQRNGIWLGLVPEGGSFRWEVH